MSDGDGILRCYECDTEIPDEYVHCEREYMGEFWGSPAYQMIPQYFICPNCGTKEFI